MDIDNTFEVPLPPARAWAILLDIKSIAGCIPGAELTEVVDERTYKGRVAVRLGPVALTLVGQATFEYIDNDTHTARVKCKGSDPKGRGATDSVIEFRIEPAATGSMVRIHSQVTLSGAVAQYGRGAGMIQSLASQIIKQFGECVKARIEEPEVEITAKPVAGLTLIANAALDSVKGRFKNNV